MYSCIDRAGGHWGIRLTGLVALAALTLATTGAWACIGNDGTIPPFGGSGPNGIMVEKIQSAWAKAAAKNTTPLTPPISGTHPTVIILIDNPSAGVTFSYTDATLWHQRILDIASYYTEVSNGQFTIAPATETYGTQNDGVIGPVTVSGLNLLSDISSSDSSESLTVQAIHAANPYIDFASYDTNGNGSIEPDELHIIIYQAGDEASLSGSTVPRAWAHESWRTPKLSGLDPSADSDGVNITSYMYLGSRLESNGTDYGMARMGAVTHELGHDIGLPDLYDVDGTASGGQWKGLGDFCLMASGGWGGDLGDSPVHIDGYFKNWLGWAHLITTTAPGNQNANLGGNDVLRVNVTGSLEFFIVENRQHTGFDQGLPGPGTLGGLAVYHCDGAHLTNSNIHTFNNVNVNPSDYGIALEEADGDNDLLNNVNAGQDADLYRAGNNTTLNGTTNPNSNLKSGASSNVALSSISASGGPMSLTVGSLVSASIGPPSVPETLDGPVSYTVTYVNAATITLLPTDVTLVPQGTAAAATVSVTGNDNSTRIVTISDITGEGSLAITIAAGTANDGSGHLVPAIGPSTSFSVGLMSVPVAVWPAVPIILAAGMALLRRWRVRQ